jgi:HNH endonuclease/AP2 domain
MKKIKLQNSYKEAECDDADYNWLHSFATWCLDSDGYPICWKAGKRMHKMIIRGGEVDHIDGNKLNNQRSNLRPVTHQQNIFNAGRHRDSSSQYKGVSYDPIRGKWRAQIMVDGRGIFIGRFPEERFAAYAYDIAAGDLFGEFAHLNCPLAYSFSKSEGGLASDPQLPA